MDHRGLFNWKDLKVYLIIMGCLIAILAYYQPILALVWTMALAYLIYHYNETIQNKEKEWIKYIEGLTEEFDSATKHAVFNMPFPLVILETDGTIFWYNTRFLSLIDEEDLLNKKIEDFVPKLKVEDIVKGDKKEALFIEYKEKYYKVYYNIVEIKKTISTKDSIIMLYWVDNTEQKLLEYKYN